MAEESADNLSFSSNAMFEHQYKLLRIASTSIQSVESMHLDGFSSVLCSSHSVDQKLGQRTGSEHEYPMTAAATEVHAMLLPQTSDYEMTIVLALANLRWKSVSGIPVVTSTRLRGNLKLYAGDAACLGSGGDNREPSAMPGAAHNSSCAAVNFQWCLSLAIKDDSREICSCIDAASGV